MKPGAKRAYRQHCGLAKALDVVGERWTLLLVRELLLGPRTWSQLLEALPGLTTNLLAKRLGELQDAGVIERHAAPEDPRPGRRGSYALSERGRSLEPVVMELARWGKELLPSPPAPGDRFDIGWALLSSKRRYTRAASRPQLVLELGAGERRFMLRASPGYLDVHEGTPWSADLVLDGDQQAVLELWFGQRSAAQLLASGRLSLVGELDQLREFLASFSGITWD